MSWTLRVNQHQQAQHSQQSEWSFWSAELLVGADPMWLVVWELATQPRRLVGFGKNGPALVCYSVLGN